MTVSGGITQPLRKKSTDCFGISWQKYHGEVSPEERQATQLHLIAEQSRLEHVGERLDGRIAQEGGD